MLSLLQLREAFLKKLDHIYHKDEIQILFLMAVEEITGLSRTEYVLNRNKVIEPTQQLRFIDVLDKLQQNVPIQHILGFAHFYGLVFSVTPDTLIPRPETEELVDTIIKNEQDALTLLDIGTGSGCIAISLAKHLPKTTVSAIDISPEALVIASNNAKKNNTDILLKQVDITRWQDYFTETDSFNVIVSNPPYIQQSEKPSMAKNVLNFEPHSALFVEDSNPLLFYDCICEFAKGHLSRGGTLYFEINQYLGSETVALAKSKGFHQVELIKDINGADRIMVCSHQK